MNPDIVYEILKKLHLDGEALVAKRIILSAKIFKPVEERKIDKPLILEIMSNEYLSLKLDRYSTIYWGDGSIEHNYLSKGYVQHKYKITGLYIVRIFVQNTALPFPYYVKKIISIGDLVNLTNMFQRVSDTSSIGKKWDTSRVVDMSVCLQVVKKSTKILEKIGIPLML